MMMDTKRYGRKGHYRMETKPTTEKQEALIRENEQMKQAIAYSMMTIELVNTALLKLSDELANLTRTLNRNELKNNQ